MHSISFDRAAKTYDATRGFPAGISEQVAGAAHQLLGPVDLVVEVGVGTGRIARPLVARGLRLIGVDLSAAMMRQMWAEYPPASLPAGLVQGDAVHLPLANGAVGAVVSVHVLHLIANWRAALDEVRRVLRPSGVYLMGYEWRPADSPGARLMARWREIVQAAGWSMHYPTLHDFEDIKAYLLTTGAVYTERSVGEWSVTRTLARQIESIEHRTWSSTWHVPDDFFPTCLAELRAWAAATFGGLDAAYQVPHRFVWQCFVWPERAAARAAKP